MDIVKREDAKQFPLMRELVARAYALLSAHAVGARFDYATLSTTIGADAQATRGRTAVLKAGTKLLREHSVLMVNVRGYGYELVQPKEHVVQAAKLRGFARRRLHRALATVTYVRMEGMTADEVNKVLSEQTRNALLLGIEKRLTRQKVLPNRHTVQLPTGDQMVSLFQKKRA